MGYVSFMRRIMQWLLLLGVILGFTVPATATEKTINIATGFSLGPYVLRSGGGILSDIIKESLLFSGYEVRFHYMSNADAIEAFTARQFDAVTVVKPGMVDGFYSEPVLSFLNSFITLADSPHEIASLDDLHDLRLAAFSNASGFLGEPFRAAITHTRGYQEISNQEEQVAALFSGDVDVILADKNIFRFFHRRLLYKNLHDPQFHQKVRFHFQFNPTFYHIGFQEQAQQIAFDRGYRRLKESGRIDAIYRYYLELLEEY